METVAPYRETMALRRHIGDTIKLFGEAFNIACEQGSSNEDKLEAFEALREQVLLFFADLEPLETAYLKLRFGIETPVVAGRSNIQQVLEISTSEAMKLEAGIGDKLAAFKTPSVAEPAAFDKQPTPCTGEDPDLFFPEGKNSPAEKRRIRQLCGKCTIQVACLAAALERKEEYGAWGGLPEREYRKALRLHLKQQSEDTEIEPADEKTE